ncbi:MAG TPA: alpha/beta hydrolase, partial [Bacteroidetes bacterium]|nr:alpha/beta hydrolase [Bacteroidota bacterium]
MDVCENIGMPGYFSFLRPVMKMKLPCFPEKGTYFGFRLSLFSLLLVFIIAQSGCKNTQLYQHAYGKKGDPGVVFLHGGPGYNAATFEIGAAEKIAEAGFQVVVYDRRGGGRSKKVKKTNYTFSEATKDLKKVLRKNKLKSATLIGHSFGGAVGTRFAQTYPEMVDQLVLVSAPLDFPGTFEAIRANCRKHYEAIGSKQLKYIDILDTMDNSRLDYATYCFSHAMACGLYSVAKPSEEAAQIYKLIGSDSRASL